ncbi:MAG TPA: TonB-dependent receptor [Asticcacaulis sp.]|nr:TonB-dependent receptor [Asticcacaulis sp.]
MSNKKKFKLALLAGAATLAFTLGAAPVFAQGQSHQYSIRAENLSDGLRAFALASGKDVVFDPALVRGKTTRGVEGQLNDDDALTSLLAGSGLAFERTSAGGYVVVAAKADTPKASPAAAVQPADDTTVVVTGFRSSLRKALTLKKDAIGVRDSIVAEDIGKFPEANVAESLQRIPGVALSRDGASAEGQRISIRGLGSQYAVTTINGMPAHVTSSSNVGGSVRDFNYDVFASELFGRVDFYKTPLAELEEGGIGGVVDLQTPRPFNNPTRTFRYALSSSYNTASKHLDPTGSFIFSDTWGDWGVLIGVAHSESVNMRSGFEATGGYNSSFRSNNAVITNPTTGATGTGGFNFTLDWTDPRAAAMLPNRTTIDKGFLPRFYRYYGAQNDRTRDGLVTSVEYKHDKLDVSFDFLGSDLRDSRDEFTFGLPIRNSATSATTTQPNGYPTHNGLVPINVTVDPATNLLTGTFGNLDMLGESYYYDDKTIFASGDINAVYKVTDRLKITALVGASKSDAFYSDNRIVSNLYGFTGTIDYTSNHVYPALTTTGIDFTDPTNYRDFQAGFDWNREIDKEKIAKLVADYDYNLPFGWTGHLKGGIEYVDTNKQKIKRNATSLGTAQIASIGLTGMQSLMQRSVPVDNLVIGSGYPQQWAVFPRAFVMGTMDPNGKAMTISPDLSTSFIADEQIDTLFLQSDFSGQVFERQLRVNIGVRDSTTKSAIDNYTKSGSSAFSPHHVEGGYRNVLPSVSAAYNLRDNLIWRASWGKTVTRASLSIIAANTVIPNIFNAAATSGNPDLKPQISTNVDTDVEWYFGRDGILSGGVFWKDLRDTTTSTTTSVPFSSLGLPDDALGPIFQDPITHKVDPNLPISLATYYNAGQQKFRGYELAYQQTFSFLPAPWDGLGALASYTHVDTSGLNTYYRTTDFAIMSITQVPKENYSVTGYFEKGPFAIRFSYNYKSRTIIETTNQGNDLERWQSPLGYLDANASWKFNKDLELRIDALNLGNALNYNYFYDVTGKYGDGRKTRMDYAKYDGRTIKIGIRGRF